MASKKVSKSSLEEISIRGLGVIESTNIEFKPGLTVLTGETGAGKTMVLTALALVLGSKSDSDLVRQGQERAVITGKFAVPKAIADLITESGGEVEDESVVITRTLSTAGKSRVLVGGAVKEKISRIRFYQGDSFEQKNLIRAGEVAYVGGLSSAKPGDVIGESNLDFTRPN